MIIGITGKYGSGKDALAQILQGMGFHHLSFSDLLRKELKDKKQEITRENLIHMGNELRKKYGPNILARKALETVVDGENYVFTSIRNPYEAELLKSKKIFLLVNVVAPINLRLKRLVERNREGDPRTMESLMEKEALENSSDRFKQQLDTLAKMSIVTIINDSTLEKLQLKAEKLVKDWMFLLQNPRPGWDEYFMNIAEAVKTRCNCLSPPKGAVIVRDRIILSTGYNGTPKGITHCREGGCLRCTMRHLGKIKPGDYSQPCTCAHSEENAIVQAAYNGASTKGAALYTTYTPCVNCAKMIINAGIKEVIAKVEYMDKVGVKLLEEAGIKLRVLK